MSKAISVLRHIKLDYCRKQKRGNVADNSQNVWNNYKILVRDEHRQALGAVASRKSIKLGVQRGWGAEDTSNSERTSIQTRTGSPSRIIFPWGSRGVEDISEVYIIVNLYSS